MLERMFGDTAFIVLMVSGSIILITMALAFRAIYDSDDYKQDKEAALLESIDQIKKAYYAHNESVRINIRRWQDKVWKDINKALNSVNINSRYYYDKTNTGSYNSSTTTTLNSGEQYRSYQTSGYSTPTHSTKEGLFVSFGHLSGEQLKEALKQLKNHKFSVKKLIDLE